jgi:CHASE3 domain sensor protein
MRGKAVNARKQAEAQERQDARNKRTDEQQLALINNRPGQSHRERAKLANA